MTVSLSRVVCRPVTIRTVHHKAPKGPQANPVIQSALFTSVVVVVIRHFGDSVIQLNSADVGRALSFHYSVCEPELTVDSSTVDSDLLTPKIIRVVLRTR